MTIVRIPIGSDAGPVVALNINGVDRSIRWGVDVDVDAAQLALLQQSNYADNVTLVEVIGGGGTIENGFGSEGFFLDGEVVVPGAFISSGYDAASHTANGMEGHAGNAYYYMPALTSAVVELMEVPHTLILDATVTAYDEGAMEPRKWARFLVDESVYFEVVIAQNEVSVNTVNDTYANAQFGLSEPPGPGRYKLAITRTADTVSASVNGGAVASFGDAVGDMTVLTLMVDGEGVIINEFAIMAPQDNADLPALSAV